VTDQAAIDVVEMVLTGTVNKQIVSAINNAGGKAVGVSGKDGQMIIAKKVVKTRRNPDTGKEETVDLGFVGEPEEVNTEVLQAIVKADMIAVIAPVGIGKSGETYNINADTVAGAVAGALKADRMLLLTDVPGVMDRNGNLIERLTTTEARALINDGTISGGMIPKVETCIDAVERGVRAAVILDGRVQHVLLIELFTEHGAGTMIVRG
jgi:acetylglutamate kinase